MVQITMYHRIKKNYILQLMSGIIFKINASEFLYIFHTENK